MPTTPTHALTYPDSGGHTRLWEHFQTLAEDVDDAITSATDNIAVLEGDFAGLSWKMVAAKLEIHSPTTSPSMSWDISGYGFTQRPMAFFTPKANSRTGDVPYVHLAQAVGDENTINILVTDARDGSSPGSTPDPLYVDALLIGPTSI